MTETPNLYDFLGVERTVAQDQIIQAFRKKAAELSSTTSDSPESSQNMQLLGQVYRTLNDPEQRRKYDATLPPAAPGANNIDTSQATASSLQREWQNEGTEDEDEDANIPPAVLTATIEPEDEEEPTDPVARELWRGWKAAAKEYVEKTGTHSSALDAVKILKPLTIDAEKQLILGYDPRYSNLIGYINIGENFNILRRMVSEKLGRTLDIRFVETTSLDEWIMLRQAELKLQHRTTQRVQAKVRANDAMYAMDNYTVGVANWDELMQGIESWPLQHPSPTPLAQARYIFQQLAAISSVEDHAHAANLPSAELQGNLNKALTRLGELTGIRPTQIALEYMRSRMR